MESLTGKTSPVSYSQINELYDSARNIIFPDFPLYKESHRIELENLILNKFLTRELCMTPYARWQIAFSNKLLSIMPYYNQLYKAVDIDVPLFDDVNYSRVMDVSGNIVMEKGTTDTSEQTLTNTQSGSFMPGTTGVVTHTSTPQTNLADFLDNSYISSADKSVTSGEDTSTTTNDGSSAGTIKRTGQDKDTETRNVTENYTGKRGGRSYAELLREIRESVFSIDNMILEELEDLFFGIY